MATKNNSGVYIDAHNDKNGTSHIDFYDRDPRGPHDSYHIDIKSDKTGQIVEKINGVKTKTPIDLNKK